MSPEPIKSKQSRFYGPKIKLFSGPGSIDGFAAQIRIERTPDHYRIVAVIADDTYEHTLVVGQDEGDAIFSALDYDYSHIVNILRFKDERLAIDTRFLKI